LAEFDENIPIDDEGGNGGVGGLSKEPELSKAEKEVQNIIKQVFKKHLYILFFA
jgi:E1A-binding protein p400